MFASAQHTNQSAQRRQSENQRDPTYQVRKRPADCERVSKSRRPLDVDRGGDNSAHKGAVPPENDSLAPDDAPAAGESIAHYLERMRGVHRCLRTFAW